MKILTHFQNQGTDFQNKVIRKQNVKFSKSHHVFVNIMNCSCTLNYRVAVSTRLNVPDFDRSEAFEISSNLSNILNI